MGEHWKAGGAAARSVGLKKRGREVLPGKTFYPAPQGMARWRAIEFTSAGTDSSPRVSFTLTSAALGRWSSFGWLTEPSSGLSTSSAEKWAGLWWGLAMMWEESELRLERQNLTGGFKIEKEDV